METEGVGPVESAVNSNEWEYEYDDNETEDIYLTLDLTEYQQDKAINSKSLPTKPSKSRPKAGNPSAASAMSLNTPFGNPAAPTPGAGHTRRQHISELAEESAGRLQILELHSDNPLVLFNNAFYSCEWSTSHGSQFYIAPSGAVKPSLRKGYVLDLVGLSSAKLVGKPAILQQKPESLAGATVDTAIAIEEAVDSHSDIDMEAKNTGDGILTTPQTAQERFAALREKTKDPEVKANASFLERLSAIKEQRGENDSIPFGGIQGYQISEAEKEDIRKRAEAVEIAKGSKKSSSARTPGYTRGPYTKRAAKTTTDGSDVPNPKRKKTGPKSGDEVRAALGLTAGPALQPLAPVRTIGPPAHSPSGTSQTTLPAPSADINHLASSQPSTDPTLQSDGNMMNGNNASQPAVENQPD